MNCLALQKWDNQDIFQYFIYLYFIIILGEIELVEKDQKVQVYAI